MILITNDDGIYSRGLKTLYFAAVEVFGSKNIVVVAPDGLRSASGMSFTFHKPLRVNRFEFPNQNGYKGYSISGTPADCVDIARQHLLKNKKIDMILSGMNIGSNASIQAVESSGTVAAVKFGAIFGIKGIAFSLATEMGVGEHTYKNAKKHLITLLKEIKKYGFPKDVDMLNVNIPTTVDRKTKWCICDLEDTQFNDFVVEKKDPRGKKYYWLWGTRKRKFTKGSYCYELLNKEALTITPLEISNTSKRLKEDVAASLKRATIA